VTRIEFRFSWRCANILRDECDIVKSKIPWNCYNRPDFKCFQIFDQIMKEIIMFLRIRKIHLFFFLMLANSMRFSKKSTFLSFSISDFQIEYSAIFWLAVSSKNFYAEFMLWIFISDHSNIENCNELPSIALEFIIKMKTKIRSILKCNKIEIDINISIKMRMKLKSKLILILKWKWN